MRQAARKFFQLEFIFLICATQVKKSKITQKLWILYVSEKNKILSQIFLGGSWGVVASNY